MNRIKTAWTSLPALVTVVAVTKTFPFEAVTTVHAMGLRHIGENRAEEAQEKIMEAKEKGYGDIIWHMVGHVQGRKAKDVARLFDWVDSVDSVEIAKKLDATAEVFGKKLHVLLEINLSGESSKFGFVVSDWEHHPEKLKHMSAFIQECLALPNLIVEGLMTMAPYVTDAEKNRPIFRSMRKLSETIRVQIPAFGDELSMGTSCDYLVAIEEGATQIRLGEALFGPRR